jgi:flagellar hook assembly protein FlgD
LFELPRSSAARVTLYDAQGRQVRVLIDGQFDAGPHQTVWDGRDAAGRAVASGAYFYALETPDGTSTRRLMLIR